MIGASLGHYRIVEKVGQGGMGVVYRARDEHLNRDVAIKVLPADKIADAAALRRFRKEAEALSKLSHPNIATVFDFDTQGEVAFLAMELVAGQPLSEKLCGGPLPEKEVVQLGAQIAAALEEAHEQGVIHRDLKPGNVVVTARGVAKVLDFGLARFARPEGAAGLGASATESVAVTRGVVGTPAYMAPEQVRGEEADTRVDIYALGGVLYEMATGQPVFREELPTRLIEAILHRAPVAPRALNPRISPELDRIVLKCLEKDPENRYQSAKDLVVDLRRLGAPSSVAAAPAAARVAGTAVPRRAAIAAAAVAAVLLVAGYAGWRWRLAHASPEAVAPAAKPSVAVLPFQNLSGDPQNEYFSDGTTEEIITKLSKIKNLEVASRTSVSRFKGTQEDVKQIGRELGVRYILEGSVRKAANRVRITAQLIDTSSGFHLWAEDFDRELKDVFAVQEETALKIADALNLRLSPQEKQDVRRRYTQDAEAYDAYLRGWALQQAAFDVPEKLELSRKEFEKALARDPDYGSALASLAIVETAYYRNLDSDPAHLQRAEQLAKRAQAIDPQLPAVHNALGQIAADRYDYRRAAQEFLEATRLDPQDAVAWDFSSWALAYEQPPEAVGAEKASREAIRLGFETMATYYHLGRALLLQGRYDEAGAAFEYAQNLSPTSSIPTMGLAQLYLAKGDYDRALSYWLRQPDNQRKAAVNAYFGASIYAARGEKEKALAELERALKADYRDFAALDASPYFNSLRSDPRFQQILKKYRQ
jgi:TolB-like protein/Flp pilus assembly protein TadD